MGYLMGSRENLKLAVTIMAGGECILPNFFFFCDTPSRGRTRNSTRRLLPPTTTAIKDNPTEDAVVPPHQEPQKLQVKFMTRHPEVSFPQPSSRQTSSGTQGASPATPLDSLTDGGIPAQLPGLVLVPEPALVRVCDLVQVRPYDRSAKVPSDAPTRLLGVFGTHA